MTDIVNALLTLRPNAKWIMNGDEYEGIEWKDETQSKPTKEEILVEVERLKQKWIDTEYQRKRAPEYPHLEDFADAYYWAQKGDNTKMNEYVAKCDAIKEKYPKVNNAS